MLRFLAPLVLCAAAAAQPIPVVLDTDIGDDIDDALALAVALQSPELDVKAVITVLQQGERRADLTYKVLELYGRTNIPVGVGAEQALLGKWSNDFVKQTDQLPADYRIPGGRRNGIQLMIDTIMKAPGKMTLLAYGPATNVALALRAEPRLKDKLDRIVLMNGVFYRAGLEYNTYRDPEASQIVYNSGIPVVTVGLDVTTQCVLKPEQLAQMAASPHESARFLRKLITSWQNGHEKQMPTLHDPLAILVTFRPDLVTMEKGSVEVETNGEPGISYGLTAFKRADNGPVQVARTVKSTEAVDLFLSRILAAPRKD
jgi:purine nucleosidase/pyrimidine-specific ribonucleoside hydrolase